MKNSVTTQRPAPRVPIGVRIRPSELEQLTQLAALQNQTKTSLIAIAVQEFLEKNATNGNPPASAA